MSLAFEVAAPGMLTTVQDLGRRGYRGQGVPVSGAMDPFALQAGNLLVGNPRGAAALEMALRGPVLRVLADTIVAACGADFGATLSGEPLPPWESVSAHAGQTLAFGSPARGTWAYLCVSGGIDVPEVMGSRSTYVRAGLGGLEGRPLGSGDLLQVGAPGPGAAPVRSLPLAEIPPIGQHADVRVVLGPQEEMFSRGAIDAFFSSRYTVTPRSDRMGYRLRGERLRFEGETEILSEGVTEGSIQVPPDGQPIVLMPDCQTTGGYAKIAVAISADLPRLAQLAPGSTVRFLPADLEEAWAASRLLEESLARLF